METSYYLIRNNQINKHDIVNKQNCKQRLTLRRRIEGEFLRQFMYTAGGHGGASGVQNFDHYFIAPEGGGRGGDHLREQATLGKIRPLLMQY